MKTKTGKRLYNIVGALGLAVTLYWIVSGQLDLGDFLYILVAMIGIYASQWAYDRFIENPYRWRCETCHLKVKTGDSEMLKVLAEQHFHYPEGWKS